MAPAASADNKLVNTTPVKITIPEGMVADEVYKKGFDQLMATQYPEAEAWFKEFLRLYPENALADNAYYWLGETYLVTSRFDDAALTFSKGLKAFPKGGKASANMLKLGTAFEKLGKAQHAKTTWEKLTQDFPESPEAEKAKANLEKLAAPQ